MIRITCINKDNGNHENPHLAITYLGWIEDGTNAVGKWARLQLYRWIKEQGGIAYVMDAIKNRVYVKPAVSVMGNPYVRTESDGKVTNNLLSLIECK
ncbi:MAG TPA: DUF3892 domain-containing protein [Patescibacteria group bacterium]|nr:DUF3892 domain-containing protein [Patescibacteria group bacterium]